MSKNIYSEAVVMQLLRYLLCGLLAVLVAITFAPESLAHSCDHGAIASAMSENDACPDTQANAAHHGEDEQAPGALCKDCCQSGHCHMKAAPPYTMADQAFEWSKEQLSFGAASRFSDAPEGREPDPERT